MPFAGYNGAVVFRELGLPELAIVARTDYFMASYQDLISGFSDIGVYWTRPAIQESRRDTRYRLRRVHVWGTVGTNSAEATFGGFLILIADGFSEVYPVSGNPVDPTRGLLLFQESQSLQGRVLEVVLVLTGQNLVVNDMEVEFIPLSGGG